MLWYLGIALWILPACFILWRFGPADDVKPSIFERIFFGLACLLWPILAAGALVGIAWSKVSRRKNQSAYGSSWPDVFTQRPDLM